jgi:transcriptional regulator with XRE-family HTH domain
MPFSPSRMRDLRIKRGMTLRGLGAKIGVKFPTIFRYEKGTITPKSNRVEQIAEALGTTREYLEGRTEDPIRLTMEDLSPDEREAIAAARRGDLQWLSRWLARKAREQMGGKT